MSEMRQELNGVKKAIEDLTTQTRQSIDGLSEHTRQAVEQSKQALEQSKQALEQSKLAFDQSQVAIQSLKDFEARVDKRFDRVDETTRNIAIIVARHEEKLVQIDPIAQRLDKMDGKIDGITRTLDDMSAEIRASRSDRLLMNRSFSEQQAALSDHEVRLYRLEQREKKPS
jgi:chromosome segregation ATPase